MSDKTRAAWISDKLHGRPVETPPGEPVSRDKMMASAISDRLQAGPQAPSDTLAPGDAVDQQATDQNAQTAEEEARAQLDQLDPAIIAAIDDDTDPSHAVAVRLLAAYVALVTIERKKAATA